MPTDPVLEVANLSVGFGVESETIVALHDVGLTVGAGEVVALVGESGSGKSLTALTVMGLLPATASVLGGAVRFGGRDLLAASEAEMAAIRGAGIALIVQEPATALNPVLTVGDQIAEVLVVHGRATRAGSRRAAINWLEAVRIPDAARRLDDYPHQLSGGQRQRVVVAMALACRPALLIADEPTTALDVTLQAELLDLLQDVRTRLGLSLLLITHDLGVVADIADRVSVIYAGRVVEEGPVADVFAAPAHPYTRGLLASIPRAGVGRRLAGIPGTVPSPGQLPAGCAFEPRCVDRLATCRTTAPRLVVLGPTRTSRCLLHDGARE